MDAEVGRRGDGQEGRARISILKMSITLAVQGLQGLQAWGTCIERWARRALGKNKEVKLGHVHELAPKKKEKRKKVNSPLALFHVWDRYMYRYKYIHIRTAPSLYSIYGLYSLLSYRSLNMYSRSLYMYSRSLYMYVAFLNMALQHTHIGREHIL